MDDDLPKEGELLDISKKRQVAQSQSTASGTPTSSAKFPAVIILIIVVLGVIYLASQGFFDGKLDEEQVAQYEPGAQSVINTMKGQLPYLTSVVCAGKNPNMPGCVNYVATFRPDKENPNYLVSMGSFDKVEGVSVTDMKIIQDSLKVLVDNKRMTLSSVHAPLTFLIDSVTVPRVGEEIGVKMLCTEDGANIITCEPKR